MSLQIPTLQWSERTEQGGRLVLGGWLRSQMGGWDTTSYPAQPQPNFRCFLIYKSRTVHSVRRAHGTCKCRVFLHGCSDLNAAKVTFCFASLSSLGTLRPCWCLHGPVIHSGPQAGADLSLCTDSTLEQCRLQTGKAKLAVTGTLKTPISSCPRAQEGPHFPKLTPCWAGSLYKAM